MRTDAATLLQALSEGERLVHLERIPARPARFGELAAPLPAVVWQALGIERLWSHQADAINLAREGRSVVVATGTASGKSLVYQSAIAEAVMTARPSTRLAGRRQSRSRSRRAVVGMPTLPGILEQVPVTTPREPTPGTALCLFPTKALAQDQLRALSALGVPGLIAATYDGDTMPEVRQWARRNATVVLTNPEMLHTAVLPFHGRWATFLRRLRYVVVDELHVLRGIFGSHTAHLLRRLRRLCAYYGSSPTFVFSSATIGDSAKLASDLCGLPVVAVTDDGSPRAERLFALWNPPLLDPESGARVPANREVARLTAALVEAGWRTVVFCRGRRGTEVVSNDVRRRLPEPLATTIRSYRAGYLAAERREIEADLFTGRVQGVVATSALELGVDIGGLDACVLNGFPGTIASMWQQAGRAGRGDGPSVAVLVAGTDQLDQWLMANPQEVFTRRPEPAVVNLANPSVLLPQLACAAYERPVAPADEAWWGPSVDEGVRQLVQADGLRLRGGLAYWNGRGSPAPGISLRSGSPDAFRIVETSGRLVGTVDASRAFEQVHPGAIYLHLGQQFRVVQLDLDNRLAHVEAVEVDEYTQVRSQMSVAILQTEQSTPVGVAGGGLAAALGAVQIATQVTGFDRRDTRTREPLGHEELDLPPTRLTTRAFWYTVDESLLARAHLDAQQVPGTLHAIEHAAIGILPLFTICDRWDVGGVSTPFLAETGSPTIVVYDGYPGGVGIAELGYAAGRRHLAATLAVIERCSCHRGCPSCVQSPKCGNGNAPLDKPGAVALLRAALAGRDRAPSPASVRRPEQGRGLE